MSRGDEPAYPAPMTNLHQGMTLREHYAGLAMQGIWAANRNRYMSEELIADLAWRQADALLAELEKSK
jgi:hypothetical protein